MWRRGHSRSMRAPAFTPVKLGGAERGDSESPFCRELTEAPKGKLNDFLRVTQLVSVPPKSVLNLLYLSVCVTRCFVQWFLPGEVLPPRGSVGTFLVVALIAGI